MRENFIFHAHGMHADFLAKVAARTLASDNDGAIIQT
jgi:hypothetical protein